MSKTSSADSDLAALPWYNFPATRDDLNTVWRETRSVLCDLGIERLPMALNHTAPYDQLLSQPRLLLAQCCGLDLFRATARNVLPFAAPVIADLDVSPGEYFSYIVVRPSSNLRAPRVVINNRSSHSGHTAIKVWLDECGTSGYTIFEGGSHAQSLAALREGRADLAAIDALSWRHLDTSGLEVLGTSESAPAPPFIMGRQSTIPPDALLAALNEGFARHGSAIGIVGVIPVAKSDYSQMAKDATAHGVLPVNA